MKRPSALVPASETPPAASDAGRRNVGREMGSRGVSPEPGEPRTAAAVKVTGLPAKPGTEAARVLRPAALPRVQAPTPATPAPLLTAVAPLTEPPPEDTEKVNVT